MNIEIRVTAFEDEFGNEDLTEEHKEQYWHALNDVALEQFGDDYDDVIIDLDWEPTRPSSQLEYEGAFAVDDDGEEKLVDLPGGFMSAVWDTWCAGE